MLFENNNLSPIPSDSKGMLPESITNMTVKDLLNNYDSINIDVEKRNFTFQRRSSENESETIFGKSNSENEICSIQIIKNKMHKPISPDNVKYFRNNLNMTQKDTAVCLHTTQQNISRIERSSKKK